VPAELDLEHLMHWIGREETAEDVVTQSLVDRFCATFDLVGNLSTAVNVAPRLIHFCLAQPNSSTSGLSEDGHSARGNFLPPVPFPRRMWAGSTITFHGDMRIGDTVHRRSRIEDVSVKQGRSGKLCFVKVGHTWTTRGTLVIEEGQTIVYRDTEASAPPSAPIPRGDPDLKCKSVTTLDIGTPFLFRYSALTFNGHRIHYDRPYAVLIERYPALVIHGPLQATLLLNLAMSENGGVPPDIFTFRSLTPLFDNQAICLHAGTPVSGKLQLWTAPPDGSIAMLAEARWT
jgi:3-methylfumaryl-CoA hydratase